MLRPSARYYVTQDNMSRDIWRTPDIRDRKSNIRNKPFDRARPGSLTPRGVSAKGFSHTLLILLFEQQRLDLTRDGESANALRSGICSFADQVLDHHILKSHQRFQRVEGIISLHVRGLLSRICRRIVWLGRDVTLPHPLNPFAGRLPSTI